VCAAFEFRHDSWLDDEVFDRLRARNPALCVADSETRSTPAIAIADYAYLRLRDEGYTEQDIQAWADRVRELETSCNEEVFVYFKHEDEGKGPYFGSLLKDFLASR
jgi:uncharacterized protein YecE (DUF72 family)